MVCSDPLVCLIATKIIMSHENFIMMLARVHSCNKEEDDSNLATKFTTFASLIHNSFRDSHGHGQCLSLD